ncbi:multiple sugar transport system permease protein [Kibdelosporangium banguiense]|uniref:Multiple sugar transport system permease protein n=1 Tax=Kibdelosporangium banguiense TaxID=1365924 RepID=A0ABS4TPT4_9PSEU|nr:sugar ABC transporter permease [Kibdelosporangium banguiense]MBP2325970.1 multiple sugar transport system permease protein [Kibdelosporangium banguiense]
MRRIRRDAGVGWVLSLPAAVVVGVFFLVPLGLAVWMSLNEWPLLGDPTFAGADNYAAIAEDELFADAIWFTVKYTIITTVVLFAVAFGLALLVQHSRPGVGLMRTAYFLPAAVGLAAASLLWFALYSNDVGPLSDVLMWLGIVDKPVQWLGTPDSALWSTVLMVTWRFAGFQMLILMTGLQSIPVDVYEAARMDGAGWWRTMRSITLPLMRPTIALLLVLSITGSLLAFEQFYLLTGGGPDNSTVTVVMVLYRQAFRLLDLGVAAAMSVVVLIALIAGNVLQLSIVRKGGE